MSGRGVDKLIVYLDYLSGFFSSFNDSVILSPRQVMTSFRIRIAPLFGPDERPSVVVAVCECRRTFQLLLQRYSFSRFFLFGDYPETGEGKQIKS